jgi:hypothetical protein
LAIVSSVSPRESLTEHQHETEDVILHVSVGREVHVMHFDHCEWLCNLMLVSGSTLQQICCHAMLLCDAGTRTSKSRHQVDPHFSADKRLETHKPKVAMWIRSMQLSPDGPAKIVSVCEISGDCDRVTPGFEVDHTGDRVVGIAVWWDILTIGNAACPEPCSPA